jgi:hypothetical protein
MLLQTDRAAYVGNDVAKGTTTVTEVALDLISIGRSAAGWRIRKPS